MPVQQRESTIRRKQNEHREKLARKRRAKISGRQPLQDEQYKAWIRTLPCCVPACTSGNLHQRTSAGAWTECAHVGDRGLRQKCSDHETLPLCAWHHRIGPLSQHRTGKMFWKKYKLDREALIAAYQLAYKELQEGE